MKLVLSLWVAAAAAADSAWADTSGTDPMEEMLVVASRLPAESYKTGRAVSVLNAQEIRRLGYPYAADLFRFIPGVAVNRSGGFGGQTRLFIRGAEGNHTVVLIDGIDVSQAGTAEFDVASLLSADIERIEVLRGPQSGLYGSNALGGVVNIQTRQPEQGFALQSQLEMGEYASRQAAVSMSGGGELISGRLSYVQRQSEFDVSSDDSVIGGEDDEDMNRTLSGQVRLQVSDHLSLALFGRYVRKETDADGFDFSGGPLQGLPFDDNSFNNTEDLTLGATAGLSLMDGRWFSRLHLASTDTELDAGGFGDESGRDELRIDSAWAWQDSGALRQHTTLFVHREEETFRNLFPYDPSQVPTLERDMLGYGVEHRVEFNDRLFVNANLRRDDNDDFDDTTTYAVDVAYRMLDLGLRAHASYGKAVTNPTFFEQFGFVPDTFVGNPALQAEQSTGWDVGVEQAFLGGALVVDATYFKADLRDEIQDRFPSVLNIEGDSDRQGLEFSVAWQMTDSTSLALHYTYTDADEPGGEEVRRPQHMASLSVVQSLLNDRAHIAFNGVYNDEMLDNDFRNFFSNGFVSERTPLADYTLVNLNIDFNVTPALAVYARVENLLDEKYTEVIGYATPGRSFYAGVRYNFERRR